MVLFRRLQTKYYQCDLQKSFYHESTRPSKLEDHFKKLKLIIMILFEKNLLYPCPAYCIARGSADIKKIPLSNNTLQRRIDEMSQDMDVILCDFLKTTQFSL